MTGVMLYPMKHCAGGCLKQLFKLLDKKNPLLIKKKKNSYLGQELGARNLIVLKMCQPPKRMSLVHFLSKI